MLAGRNRACATALGKKSTFVIRRAERRADVMGESRIGGWILIGPAAVLLGLLGAAVASMLAASLAAPASGPTLAYYQRFLSDPTYLAYISRSFRVAFYTTAGALLLGYPVAYTMSRVSARTRRLLVLVLVLQFFSVNV